MLFRVILVQKRDNLHFFMSELFGWRTPANDEFCRDSHLFQLQQCFKSDTSSFPLPIETYKEQFTRGRLPLLQNDLPPWWIVKICPHGHNSNLRRVSIIDVNIATSPPTTSKNK